MATRPTSTTTATERRSAPRVVIAHDFAETFGGAERIVAEMAAVFPEAPLWALVGRRSVARRMGVGPRFHTVLPQRDRLLRHYRRLAPLYPLIVRARRLPEADVLLTSSYAFAHGFSTRDHAPQVCYCYSPLRFAWSMTGDYGRGLGLGPAGPLALGALAAPIRALDRRAARRVTRYVAESHFVAEQIERYYGLEAEVLWPPVDCDLFRPDEVPGHDDYYLFCGRLTEPYKRPSLVVEAFRSFPGRLLVAGEGPALPALRRMAPPNVEFLGQLDDAELVRRMQRCAAAIFPSRDDFGLIPVEVMACGRPVLAHAAGGALETVIPGVTGELFGEQSTTGLVDALRRFDAASYEPGAIRAHAERFSAGRFRDRIEAIVSEVAATGR